MKISELTKQLNQIKLGHGDLICEVHDGFDPSEPTPVRELMISGPTGLDKSEVAGENVVYISS